MVVRHQEELSSRKGKLKRSLQGKRILSMMGQGLQQERHRLDFFGRWLQEPRGRANRGAEKRAEKGSTSLLCHGDIRDGLVPTASSWPAGHRRSRMGDPT